MLTYEQLKERIAKSRGGNPKIDNNTYARYTGAGVGDIAITLHHTDIIIAHPDGTFTLTAGGWETITTKDRLNKFSPANIYQTKRVWYIGDIEFYNGVVVDANGHII